MSVEITFVFCLNDGKKQVRVKCVHRDAHISTIEDFAEECLRYNWTIVSITVRD